MPRLRLTDTHCHLNLSQFDDDRDAVLQHAIASGVDRMLIPAINVETSLDITRFIQKIDGLFGAVGVHPNDASDWDATSYDRLAAMIEFDKKSRKKIVAIGEIGLDHYWEQVPRIVQESVLKHLLELATETQLPIILHMREKDDKSNGSCAETMLSIVSEWVETLKSINSPLQHRPGVFHSFSGDLETLNTILGLNFFVGVSGPVTYKQAEYKREVVKSIPLNKILIETDSPFLAPVPNRGRRNEPAFVNFVAEKIAELFDENPEMIANITCSNANRLFSWEVNF